MSFLHHQSERWNRDCAGFPSGTSRKNLEMDEPVAEKNLKQFKRKIRKVPVLPISAGLGEGIEEFKNQIREAVEETVA